MERQHCQWIQSFDTSGNLRSRHFSAHSDDMKNSSRQRREAAAIHWKLWSPNSEISVSNGWMPLTHWQEVGSIYMWQGSNKTRCQYCQNSCNHFLSELFKVTQEEKRLNLRWWVMCPYNSQESVCIPPRMFVQSEVNVWCRSRRRTPGKGRVSGHTAFFPP